MDPKILQEDIEDWEKCNQIGEKTPIRITLQRRLGRYELAEDVNMMSEDVGEEVDPVAGTSPSSSLPGRVMLNTLAHNK